MAQQAAAAAATQKAKGAADQKLDLDFTEAFSTIDISTRSAFAAFTTLYPTSLYGILVCILRGFYHVSMSLVLVVMIDFIWLDPAGVRTCRRGKEHA